MPRALMRDAAAAHLFGFYHASSAAYIMGATYIHMMQEKYPGRALEGVRERENGGGFPAVRILVVACVILTALPR